MLYNQEWERKTPPPMSLESLIAWLEKKPADGSYVYQSHGSCLIAQYMKDQEFTDVFVDSRFYEHDGCGLKYLPVGWDAIARSDDWRATSELTFGKALARAKELALSRELQSA